MSNNVGLEDVCRYKYGDRSRRCHNYFSVLQGNEDTALVALVHFWKAYGLQWDTRLPDDIKDTIKAELAYWCIVMTVVKRVLGLTLARAGYLDGAVVQW